jgi:hypothetical protein
MYDDTVPIIDREQLVESKEILKDKFPPFIVSYIAETESILFEMDLCRSTEQHHQIGELAHQLKSSSFQTAASGVLAIATDIDMLIRTHEQSLSSLKAQSELDILLTNLKMAVHEYKHAMKEHL